MCRHRITVSPLLIVLVLLGVAVAASQVAARPDDGSARSATTIYQENNAKLAYSSPWKAVRTSKCMGGCMRTRSAAGSVTATFTGTGVSVFVTKGRAYGIMKVTLDGVARKVSLYASSTAYKRKAYSRTGLADGPHTLTLAWTGKKVAAAKAKTVNLDAISIQGKLTQAPTPTPTVTPAVLPGTAYQETDSRLRYLGAWTSASSASFSGGTQKAVNGPGAVVISFTGTEAYVVASKGPAYGVMRVALDNDAPVNVDLYAATAKYQQAVFSKPGLTNAAHWLVLDWTGGKNAAASAATINLDAVNILGTLNQAPDYTGGLVGFWAAPPAYNWAETYAFRADGSYTYLVEGMIGVTYGLYREEGLYVTYQGQTAKMLRFFDRWNRFTPSGGPDGRWESLGNGEWPYQITYYTGHTKLNIIGKDLNANFWLR